MHGPGDVRFFDRLARLYDLVMPRARAQPLRAGLERAERPVERVVDLGGGTGRATRAVDAGERTVVDAAPGMLRRARARGLATLAGDARRLPLRPERVDAVLVVDALHHMPETARVLAECERVLRPGGVLVVREFDPESVLGRGLVLGEALLGLGSRFFPPDVLAGHVDAAGLDPHVLERGFGYTLTGVKRESKGASAGSE